MNRDYDALFKAGNKAQREKLEQNGHKEGFEDIILEYTYRRIVQEVIELEKAIYQPDKVVCYGEYDLKNVRHEAADIANFAHMIILACDKEINKCLIT